MAIDTHGRTAPIPKMPRGGAEPRNEIVRRILQRAASGASIRANTVEREDHELFAAAVRHFRIWGNALRTAGLDPEIVSGRWTWTADLIVQQIQNMAREGIALNYASVKRKLGQRVGAAARKLLGSWDDALRLAGYDPLVIRRLRRPWTKSAIIHAIRARAEIRSSVTHSSMRPTSAVPAALRIFGSFKNALQKAGVRYSPLKPHCWSRSAVVRAIRARCDSNQPVNCTAVIRDASPLYDAARRYLGGWNQALRAAGLDPDRVRLTRRPWTAKDVTDEIRRRVISGEPAVYISAIRPATFFHACERLFGSWEAAATAAKVDPARFSRSKWHDR